MPFRITLEEKGVGLKTYSLGLCGLALVVVFLGAYTRLKQAGLGCPDWPQCYGKWVDLASAKPESLEKAWIEMIHRYVAGLLVLGLLGLGYWVRQSKAHLPLRLQKIPRFLLLLVAFQALLGMWTVTLRLYPVVVMGHLLGGLSLIAGLFWFYLQLTRQEKAVSVFSSGSRLLLIITCLALALQLLLGGWTSANEAGLVCLDFPLCQGLENPELAWRSAFRFWLAGYEVGGTLAPLSFIQRATVHMAHRYGAVLVTVLLLSSITLLWKRFPTQRWGLKVTLSLLALQWGLGILAIVHYLPLSLAFAHHIVAVLLLLTWLKVLSGCWQKRS